MENSEIVDKILNKKFKKSVFSGYDSTDVDSFFDFVIEHIQSNIKLIKSNATTISDLEKQVKQLQLEKTTLQNDNNRLNKEVEEYQEEGYGNMLLKRRSQKK